MISVYDIDGLQEYKFANWKEATIELCKWLNCDVEEK